MNFWFCLGRRETKDLERKNRDREKERESLSDEIKTNGIRQTEHHFYYCDFVSDRKCTVECFRDCFLLFL